MDEKSFYESLPTKRIAAGALFLNEHNELLLVKPHYREQWLLPGGVVEKDESPKQACIREIKEELGLQVRVGKLLCVDYKVPQAERAEGLQFVFFGGRIGVELIRQIRLQSEELEEYRFAPREVAVKLLDSWSAKRIPFALRAIEDGNIAYLENGQEV